VLVAAVVGLSLTIMRSSDQRITTSTTIEGAVAPSSSSPGTITPTSGAPVTEGSRPVASSEPVPVPSSAPPVTEPVPSPPVDVWTDELVAALDGYVAALDATELDLAYSYVSMSLRDQDGWDWETFSTFWTESVVGAYVVSVEDVDTSTGEVRATVDYALPDGATSREQVAATFEPAGDAGLLVMVAYEVIDTEHLPPGD
jgi:hypothetical protein